MRQNARATLCGCRGRCYYPRRFSGAGPHFPARNGRFPTLWKGAVDNTSVVQVQPIALAVWDGVLERAKRDLAESSFNMWFAEIRPGTLEGGVLELLAPSDYVRDWLAKNYLELIQEAATDAAGESVRVSLVVDARERPAPEPVHVPEAPRAATPPYCR